MAVLLVLAGCSSSDNGSSTWPENPTGDIEIAEALIPWGEYQATKPDVDEATLTAFLACTEDEIEHQVVILGPGDEDLGPPDDNQYTQTVAASDCALEHGIDEVAAIWVPPTGADFARINQEAFETAIFCLHEEGVENPPMIDYGDGFDLPDLTLVSQQNPALEDPLRECMNSYHQDFPGDP